jgi:hypothetical protein
MNPHTPDTGAPARAAVMPPAAGSVDRRPPVSVVLLSYDRPGLLREALDSVFAQTHARVEVIVVNNPKRVGTGGE